MLIYTLFSLLFLEVSAGEFLCKPASYGRICELGLTETAGLQERLTGGADEVTLGALVDWGPGDLQTDGAL